MKRPAPWLLLLLLATICFTLATFVQPRAAVLLSDEQSASVVKILLGDSRRIFADQLFRQADVSFHSGYYPSVWDQANAAKDTRHMTAKEGSPEEEEHERQMAFLGPPTDWFDSFGRHFMVTQHTHLHGGKESEILPWLKLSADLDPHRIETYSVAAYWLTTLGKPAEAEKFLREGLRNNPDSYQLLFDMGRLYHANLHDDNRARDIWELALRRWRETESGKKDPDKHGLEQIVVNLAHLEEQVGDLMDAVIHLEMAANVSPHPEALLQQITELKSKLAQK